MKIASYNIQFGIGLDGVYNPERIAASLEGADIIALQEVTRGFPKNGGRDMVAEITTLFPDFFVAYGPAADLHLDFERREDGIFERRLQFGNMILSRWPLLSTRHLLLPRSRTIEKLNYQRSVLEGIIETPLGPLRVYSTHLDHMNPSERIAQIRFLKDRLFGFALEGAGVTGGQEFGLSDPPLTEDFVILGDFNMSPESPEYLEMAGQRDIDGARNLRAGVPVDALNRLGKRDEKLITWTHPDFAEGEGQYLDYAFVNAGLAPKLEDGWIDLSAKGSDHFPLWLSFK
ncbi:endonuclease/exonuclease/phosphatase family protein [Martelella mediterranea]|uniref:Endonuclease/exonuclease/phosphatase family metal-dependent hydrolase n=1 Tax=Martelella mediterranea TaxID=293089 RepID=A0A4R3NR52_9HYPH|nr:endonuclease/exonuclease/phosphatase family protein [Martelella mediterranea]TCT35356.1 endonuclease/exonuclease/phosphatase family metal-dependent hydrolase [Martelella mediterranea]